ncbi:Peroxisomal membrane protein PEX14 [Nakaseomyces glabratus]|uniref:Peroxisomal membrane protein PEX14 n=1 Tax=Candida glabrata TaxID=5478 RepID=A0A0W0EDC0_CANGB|nr:Peroxisomal membrane protein PEX14 [Nakaseomyces glabratus]KTB03792.1 Peroxisomal membrane protein PEX14 [Nakaseomyces glabratus]KTB06350.1 Peroxisomal membrane protein PEX14 [Nakaseomyces glabratus]KTB22073.1 Peroxisomal membrane protein PEX14 [Nakaseomyces glabratus]
MPVTSERKELFDSAVSFLQDSAIKDASLDKKVEFLKSKGLGDEEVELALQEAGRRSRDAGNAASDEETATQGNLGHSLNTTTRRRQEYMYEAIPPPLPQRDWKDYFVMATMTAGLFYGVYEVTKRYVVPNLLPESTSKLEQDKEDIKKEFEKVDQILSAIQDEQADFKEKEQEKLNELDEVISDLKMALRETTNTKEKMEDDFRLLKLEITTLQNSIDKFMSDNSNVKELETLSREVMSLKNLITVAKTNKDIQNGTGGSNLSGLPGKSLSPGGLPGADSIPSAADILARMNINGVAGKSAVQDHDPNESGTEPQWKKVKDNMVDSSEFIPEWQRAKTPNDQAKLDIPEWQKAALKSDDKLDIPDWQNIKSSSQNTSEDN